MPSSRRTPPTASSASSTRSGCRRTCRRCLRTEAHDETHNHSRAGRAPGRSQAGPHPKGHEGAPRGPRGSAAVLRGRGAVMTEPIIRIEKVNKWYGHFQVLTDVDLDVRAGERIVICGPSGSGKSTLIRCINHLEKAQ